MQSLMSNELDDHSARNQGGCVRGCNGTGVERTKGSLR